MTAAPKWTDTQAAEATGGRNTAPWAANGVSIDSRSLAPRDLFIALQGPSFDGHDFIAKAFESGAAAAVLHRRKPVDASGPLLLVDDTMAALRGLGQAARARSRARFIGVTGSVGKTGTKEALARALRAQAPTAASAGSLNNHWGLPLSLARLSLASQRSAPWRRACERSASARLTPRRFAPSSCAEASLAPGRRACHSTASVSRASERSAPSSRASDRSAPARRAP